MVRIPSLDLGSQLTRYSLDDNIYEHKFAPEDCLGLDHVDKSGKARGGAGEKAIFIRG